VDPINRAFTWLFDLALAPLSFLPSELQLVLVSGVLGVLALLVFKQISAQAAIKSTKDQIKARIIEIRIYQHDLGIVSAAVGRVLLLNLKYLALNFGPILPLLVPFAFIAAQLVCRFGFAPLPLLDAERRLLLPGAATVVEVQLAPGREDLLASLSVELPAHLVETQPLLTNRSARKAWFEVRAAAAGSGELRLRLGDGSSATKQIVSGAEAPAGLMSPERDARWYQNLLYPAEPSLSGGPFERIQFAYPNRELRWMLDGPLVVLLTFLLASMAFGFLALKPLKIQI
jgi:hypothetical protein